MEIKELDEAIRHPYTGITEKGETIPEINIPVEAGAQIRIYDRCFKVTAIEGKTLHLVEEDKFGAS